LIALLARYPLASPSSSWLGHDALPEAIRTSGLWNTQHIASPPFTAPDAKEFFALVAAGEGALNRR
jgi:hypothetical protein